MSRTRPDLAHVPLRDRGVCIQCGDPLDTRGLGVWVLVRGWVENRAQGGANMVSLREPLGQYLCSPCYDKRKAGHAWDQLGLFDEEP